MKTILTATLLVGSSIVFAQEQGGTTTVQPTTLSTPTAQYKGATHTEVSQSQTATISKRPGEPQRVHDVAYYNEEIAKIDAHIAAIDAKIAHVNATPSELSVAQQNGWFQQMDQIKTELNERRATLVEKRDSL